MDEDSTQALPQDNDQVAGETLHEGALPASRVMEMEEAGGDPACWLHLLDEEGNIRDG